MTVASAGSLTFQVALTFTNFVKGKSQWFAANVSLTQLDVWFGSKEWRRPEDKNTRSAVDLDKTTAFVLSFIRCHGPQ